MASSTSRFAAAIALYGIEDENEPLGSGRLLMYFIVEKNFVHIIFAVMDGQLWKFLTANISRYTVLMYQCINMQKIVEKKKQRDLTQNVYQH